MAYYYVKHTGSSITEGGTTKKTGPFSGLAATAVYGSITDAITYGAGSGDIVCVSTAHAASGIAVQVYGNPSIGEPLYVQTVKDAECAASSIAVAPQETVTGTADVSFRYKVNISGVWFKSSDDISASTNADLTANNCTFEVTGATDRMFSMTSDGANATLKNCTLKGVDGSFAKVSNGGRLILDGGKVDGPLSYFMYEGFTSGGGTLIANGFDLSSVTGTLFKKTGSSPTDATIQITLNNCKLNAGVTFFDETLAMNNQRVSTYNSASSSAAAEYQFYIEAMGGKKVEDQADSGIHRDESTAFPSGTKVSASCLTDDNASLGAPFLFELPARYAELSTATDTLRVYLTSETALDDTDVWVEVLYADGTNKHEQNYITTRNPERMIVASGGTPLTTDSGSTWKDGASDIAGTFNEYYIDIDTSGNAGADCVPTIKINVAIPNTQIYFDVAVDVV